MSWTIVIAFCVGCVIGIFISTLSYIIFCKNFLRDIKKGSKMSKCKHCVYSFPLYDGSYGCLSRECRFTRIFNKRS